MENDELLLYRRWLACGLKKEQQQEKQFVQDSFAEALQSSSAYQSDATVNGNSQPLVATRTSTKKCKVTVIPGTRLYIGDLVRVFGEYWICVEIYVDEYEMWYGELWMCNQIFCYQDHDYNIIHKYAIMDDGSYSSSNDKALEVTDNGFKCYISLDDESKALYVDKRLAISTIYDAKGKEILEVGQIQWIDTKSKNFGEGSHLMLFGIKDDVFNAETDSIEELICDYVEPPKVSEEDTENVPDDGVADGDKSETPTVIGVLRIEGKNTIRTGSSRSYIVKAVRDDDEDATLPDDVECYVVPDNLGIVTQHEDDNSWRITVPEKGALIGQELQIVCSSAGGQFAQGMITVEVI